MMDFCGVFCVHPWCSWLVRSQRETAFGFRPPLVPLWGCPKCVNQVSSKVVVD